MVCSSLPMISGVAVQSLSVELDSSLRLLLILEAASPGCCQSIIWLVHEAQKQWEITADQGTAHRRSISPTSAEYPTPSFSLHAETEAPPCCLDPFPILRPGLPAVVFSHVGHLNYLPLPVASTLMQDSTPVSPLSMCTSFFAYLLSPCGLLFNRYRLYNVFASPTSTRISAGTSRVAHNPPFCKQIPMTTGRSSSSSFSLLH